jgi:CRISPR-associated protein Cas1
LNPLLLSGYGVKIKLEKMRSSSNLAITDGHEGFNQPRQYSFRPRRIPYDSIIIDGHSGYVSLQAFHWLSRNRVPVFILNYDGSLISSILPPMPVKADLRAAQLKACEDPEKKRRIAYELVKAKIQRSNDVLKWLGRRYDIERDARRVAHESDRLSNTRTVNDIRMVEGRVAQYYWQAVQSIFPETFCFKSRIVRSHQYNASDPVNLCLNYAYGVLEGECKKAINTVGLEPAFGFLHEFSDYQTKQSLVYDLQEPFRWLCDLTVIEGFESGAVDLKDFYFMGDDYRYHIEIDAKRQFLELLKERFNAGAKYEGKLWKWDTIIPHKTQELACFLLGKCESLDFTRPIPNLARIDDLELRRRILELTPRDANERGICKSTLHDLRKHATNPKPSRLYKKVANRLLERSSRKSGETLS